jgi:chemotaxis protein methyltransferase CheR
MKAEEAAYRRLKRAVIARTGHHYYDDKDALLRKRLDERAREVGAPSLAAYEAALADPATGDGEWRALEAAITVGETFFFRHSEQFATLRDTIFPDLLAVAANRRRLRIWSAGCSTGAEPYSLAILIERLLGEALPAWHVEILGTDINEQALVAARRASYSAWSLRGMTEGERARDFDAETKPSAWRLHQRHRPRVEFHRHNLLDLLPEPPAEWREFDLILCRNVLIYFGAHQAAPMLSALGKCLSPRGWLMIGYSDALADIPPELEIVQIETTRVFRPRGTAAQVTAVPAALPQPPLPAPRRAPPRPASSAPRAVQAPAIAAARADDPDLDRIRKLADTGRLEEAAVCCARDLQAHPLDHRLHYYDALLAEAAGDRSRAEAALRRAIYLRNDMVMAHYHLGLLLLRGGAAESGRRVMSVVLELCRALPEDTLLPEGDGLHAGDLLARAASAVEPAMLDQASQP